MRIGMLVLFGFFCWVFSCYCFVWLIHFPLPPVAVCLFVFFAYCCLAIFFFIWSLFLAQDFFNFLTFLCLPFLVLFFFLIVFFLGTKHLNMIRTFGGSHYGTDIPLIMLWWEVLTHHLSLLLLPSSLLPPTSSLSYLSSLPSLPPLLSMFPPSSFLMFPLLCSLLFLLFSL